MNSIPIKLLQKVLYLTKNLSTLTRNLGVMSLKHYVLPRNCKPKNNMIRASLRKQILNGGQINDLDLDLED